MLLRISGYLWHPSVLSDQTSRHPLSATDFTRSPCRDPRRRNLAQHFFSATSSDSIRNRRLPSSPPSVSVTSRVPILSPWHHSHFSTHSRLLSLTLLAPETAVCSSSRSWCCCELARLRSPTDTSGDSGSNQFALVPAKSRKARPQMSYALSLYCVTPATQWDAL